MAEGVPEGTLEELIWKGSCRRKRNLGTVKSDCGRGGLIVSLSPSDSPFAFTHAFGIALCLGCTKGEPAHPFVVVVVSS